MKKYRIKAYDIINDIWILQEQVFWIFYRSIGAGKKAVLEKKIEELIAL